MSDRLWRFGVVFMASMSVAFFAIGLIGDEPVYLVASNVWSVGLLLLVLLRRP